MYKAFAEEEPSLASLMNYVGHLEHKWKDVGIELGLEPDVLDGIRVTKPCDPNGCMTMVFAKWQQIMTKPYTWQTILVALCKPLIDNKGCAENTALKLREK